MFIKLLLLFMIVPIVELALLIELGTIIGVAYTILLVGITGVIGVTLARNQGFKIINKIKTELNSGKLPAEDMISGLLILIGGIMLLTPGLLTDITGFSLILPGSRSFFVSFLQKRFKGYIKKNINYQHFQFSGSEERNSNFNEDFVDVEYEETGDEED